MWVVSELYYPEATSTGFILTRIAEGLANDHVVHVLCAWPSYTKQITKAPRSEIHHRVNIRRCSSTTFNKDIFVLRILNLTTSSLSIFLHALANFRSGDVALVVTNPPVLPYLIRIACMIRRTKCILLVHDVYPELLVAVGKIAPDGISIMLMKLASRALYRSMDKIIAIGRDMKKLIADKLRRNKDRVVFIGNWADVDLIHPQPKSRNKMLRELHLENKFIVLYAGNMGYPHDIDTIMQAALKLQGHKDIHFLFIGSGFKKRWLERSIDLLSLKNMSILPAWPREAQSLFLSGCDVGLISLVQGMKGVSAPSRLYNLLAAEKPIIAIVEKGSEAALVIEELRVGWIIPPGQPDSLAQTILIAKMNTRTLTDMGRRARGAAETVFSLDHVLSQYRQLLSRI